MSQRTIGTDLEVVQTASDSDHAVAWISGATKEITFSGLPASGPTVAAIQSAIQSYDATVEARLQSINPSSVGPIIVDGQTFTDLNAAMVYVAQKAATGGASAPVISAAPTISDSTVDFNQVVTVTAGTTSSGTVTSRLYRWIVSGVSQSTLWDLGLSGEAQAVGGTAPATAQSLVLEELLYWAGGTPVSNKSIQYALNAGAAVPFNSSAPSVSGTASPGNTLSISGGTWTNSPTSGGYSYYVYDGGTPAQGGVLLATYTSQTPPLSFVLTAGVYDAKTLVFGVTASNGTGTSSPAYSDPTLVSGGLKPVNISPIGIRYAVQYAVGDTISLDYGLLSGSVPSDFWSNNPSATGFTVTMYRNGVPISGGGQNVTQYTTVSADQDKIISYSVVASNGRGASAAAFAAGVLVVSIGGTAGISFVGSTRNGANAISHDLTLANVSPGSAQSSDVAMIVSSMNTGVTTNFTPAPSGFSVEMAQTRLTLVGETSIVWGKVLTGGEPPAFTVTLSQSDRAASMLLVFRGASSIGNSAGPTSQNSGQSSPATVTFPSVTTTVANQRMVLVATIDGSAGGASTWTPPSGFNVIAQMDQNFVGINQANIVVMLSDPIASTGATGTKAANLAFTGGSFGWICDSFFLG